MRRVQLRPALQQSLQQESLLRAVAIPQDAVRKLLAGHAMYLLEIELLRQENLSRQQQGLQGERREGDYYLEKYRDKNPLQQLATEYWVYQEQPSYESLFTRSTLESDNERYFQQQIVESAHQLVTTLAQTPETIEQILQHLEQEFPEALPLGLFTTGNNILSIIESQSAFADLRFKMDGIFEGKVK